jgi:hypothetical protein
MTGPEALTPSALVGPWRILLSQSLNAAAW